MISQYSPPDVGGASTRVSNLISALKNRGDNVVLITAFPHYPDGNIPRDYRNKALVIENRDGVRVVRVWIPPFAHRGVARRFALYATFALTALFALPYSGKVDSVWAVSPNYLSVIPASVLKIARRCKLIHDVVDIWPQAIESAGYHISGPMRWVLQSLADVSYAVSDAIVTLSPALASSLKKSVPASVPVSVIGNCVNDGFFDLSFSPNTDVKNVMYLGTLSPANDFSLIVEAAKKLRNQRLRFTIIGSGEMAGSIVDLLEKSHLKSIHFEAHPVNHDDVPARLSEADILILALKPGFGQVSFPSKLVEYLATGRPVICVTDGELAKVIRSQQIALVTEPGDANDLVNAIMKLSSDHKLFDELRLKGRQYAYREYSFQSFNRKVGMMTPSMTPEQRANEVAIG